jgi:hypothetical protein
MTTANDTGHKTFQATAVAIEAYVRVAFDANGLIAVAGETDLDIGVTEEYIAASGYGTVKLWSAAGTFLVQAAAAITCGAQLYAKAAGEVDDTGTYKARLIALAAATAQGDVIEVAKIEDATYGAGALGSTDIGTVAAAGADQAGATAIANVVTYVTASNGAKGVRLPAAAAGLVRWVYNTVAANNLLFYPATDDDINDGTTNVHVTQTGKTLGVFVAVDGVTWMAMFT